MICAGKCAGLINNLRHSLFSPRHHDVYFGRDNTGLKGERYRAVVFRKRLIAP